jgi:hypothetical protein
MPHRFFAGCEAGLIAGGHGGWRNVARRLGVAVAFTAASASASAVDVRCPELAATERGELQARARLLLSSAGFEAAHVTVECNEAGAWLIWTDGGRSAIDVHSGIVEGALDAIESRVSAARRSGAAGSDAAPVAPPPTLPAGSSASSAEPVPAAAEPASTSAADADGAAGTKASELPGANQVPISRGLLEGGVGIGTTTERWSGASPLGVGLRLDVGVGFGDQFALVIGQSVRIALPVPPAGQITVYDLQLGIAVGAPYRARTGLGLVLLGGAERLSVSNSNFGSAGFWLWAVAGSLGARASLQAGAIDLWLGADIVVRTEPLEVKKPSVAGVPGVSGALSIGCFFPAFSRDSASQPSASLRQLVRE